MSHCTSLPVCEILVGELISRRKLHLSHALKYVGRPDAAEDILQNTALKCLSSPPQTPPDSPRCYVSRMVRNAAIDYLRKHAREVSTSFEEEGQLARAGTTSLCGHVCLEDKQELAAVARALSRLPARKRDAFLRHRLSEVPQKRIAEELKVSRALINVMIKQADRHCAMALTEGDAAYGAQFFAQ
ncbi:sigma-70 family RNA polymerase sigma factor [Phaeobacter sp. B1627]|uniref:sigma-70 family RNA polymerase sigma factor n=1 Tax=Phaeobacter sp. B1627 TaxID=2583809 RepID=UPI00111AD282|nr:sigma-70 family RNA polymerase sigma factor [Phaeobacter sp. B1627]TNJ42751.1 sigma-70 family RNA polymerase sigma factor [Phaeobacter sp. B1627]